MDQTKCGKVCIAIVVAMVLFFIGWLLIRPATVKQNCFKEADKAAAYDQFDTQRYERCLLRNGL
jgi:hypothetical protein